jgi:hypothetical protein
MHGITSHKTLSNSIPLFVYRSCTRDICKISTFSNFQMFGWIKSKLFPCLTRGFSFYYIKQMDKFAVVCSDIDTQYDVIMWEEQSDILASAAPEPFFCSFYIMTSYCVSITGQTTAKSYLFVNQRLFQIWGSEIF